MKKSLGVKPFIFPMPVVMISTYNEDDSVNSMAMSWGGICSPNMVALNINSEHKTSINIMERRAFTLSIADVDHVKEADYLGMVSGDTVEDKFERTKLNAVKSEKVDAPIITDFPLTLECELVECQDQPYGFRVLGKIVDVLAEEELLDSGDNVDPTKLEALIFDQFQNGYYVAGEKVGQAWDAGKAFEDQIFLLINFKNKFNDSSLS